MKNILILIALTFVFISCGSEHKTCFRACTKAVIADLGVCSEKHKDGGDADSCIKAAKKKGRDCIAACPPK